MKEKYPVGDISAETFLIGFFAKFYKDLLTFYQLSCNDSKMSF